MMLLDIPWEPDLRFQDSNQVFRGQRHNIAGSPDIGTVIFFLLFLILFYSHASVMPGNADNKKATTVVDKLDKGNHSPISTPKGGILFGDKSVQIFGDGSEIKCEAAYFMYHDIL